MIKVENQTLHSQDIWDQFSTELRRFVKSRLHDEDIVNDIIQEIFLKIHTNIDTLKDKSKIRGWVYQISRNAIIDYFRAEKKARAIIDNLKIDEENKNYFLDTSIDEILKFCMDYFVGLLPDIYKQAIIFTEIEGNTQTVLAEKEGISVSAAKSRVQRAREMIRKMLLEYYHTIQSPDKNLNANFLVENCPFCK